MSAWPIVKLQDLVMEARSGFASGARSDTGVIQVRMNNVTIAGELSLRSFIRVPADEETIECYRLSDGDVLFNNTNSTELVGKTALFTGHSEPVVFSNHFTRIRTKRDLLEPGFLVRWLNLQWRQKLFERLCDRWIGQSAIKNERLLPLAIPLPPLAEQQRSVAALDAQLAAAARARAAVAAQLDAATRLQTAQLEEFFPAANSTPSVPLEELVAAPLRTGLSKPMLPGSPIQCLSLSAVRSGVLDLNACKPVDVTPEEAAASQIKPGAFYVVRGNGNRSLVGRGGLAPAAPAGMTFPDLLFEVVPDVARLLPDFLRWAWDSPGVRRQIEDKAQTSAGIYKINQGNLRGIRLPLPSLDEQARLVRELQVRDAVTQRLVAGLRARLSALDALPARLLARAFTAPHGQGQNTEEAQLAVLR